MQCTAICRTGIRCRRHTENEGGMCRQHFVQQQTEPEPAEPEPAHSAAEPAEPAHSAAEPTEPAHSATEPVATEPVANENSPEVVMRKVFDLIGTIDNAVDAVLKSVDDDLLRRMLLGMQSSVLKVLLKSMRQLYNIAHKV